MKAKTNSAPLRPAPPPPSPGVESLTSEEPISAEAARALRRRELQHQQTKVIGGLLVAMVAAVVLALPFAVGLVALPFGNDFSTPPESMENYPPCIPKGQPVDLSTVNVVVYNGATRPGLATQTADQLSSMGVKVKSSGNAPEGSYDGTALLKTGKEGVAKAYSVARLLPGAQVKLIKRGGSQVDILLGEDFANALGKDDLPDGVSAVNIEPPIKCQKIEQESAR